MLPFGSQAVPAEMTDLVNQVMRQLCHDTVGMRWLYALEPIIHDATYQMNGVHYSDATMSLICDCLKKEI